MQSLFPEEKSDMISASILLSNTYASLGDDEQVKQIREDRIKKFGNKVKVGISWTEVNGELVVKENIFFYDVNFCFCLFKSFTAHDRSHPQSDEIYAELGRLSHEIKAHGHEYDSTWITRPLQHDETIESVLCGHSEKLALAFNFIANRRPSFIQITKNLRVCGDCRKKIYHEFSL